MADGSGVCTACGGAAGPSAGAAAPRNEGMAIASLILGLLALFPFSFITGIPAVILGHLSFFNIGRSRGRLRGRGMAMAGLLMGYISIALVAGVGVRNLMQSRSAANDRAAEANMRKVSTLIATYRLTYEAYPPSLAVMGPSADGSPNASAANLLRAEELNEMASGKRGYIFIYQRTREGYMLRADPVSFSSGKRHFYIDQTGSLRVEEKQPAGPNSGIATLPRKERMAG
jgi:type II secretory pathway pseudopilin PulG